MKIDDFLEKEQFRELDLFLTGNMNKYAGAELVKRMIEVFEDKNTARDWFYSPLVALQGKRPYDYCKEGKAREIENELGRIEEGIFQ